MMKCLLMASVVAACALLPSESELRWIDDYGAALEASRTLQKPLLIVIDDSSHSESQFQHAGVTQGEENADLLEEYVLCRVDVTTDYGKRVADVFKVEQYPFAAITDKVGEKIVYRKNGQLDEAGWVAALENHKPKESRTASRIGNRRSTCYT